MKKLFISVLWMPIIAFGADAFNVLDSTSMTISGGTINNTSIGQTTAAAGSFTTVTATTPIAAPNGGTGVATLTGLALGNGASAFSAYGGTSCTNQFPRSLSASGAATCATVSLTGDVTGIAPSANGGTGIAFFTAAGPTVARVYTFPDAAATMLYSGGALGTPSSGVATNLTGTASGLTAGTVTTNANLTGGVTSVGNAATVVTNANLTGPITSTGNATAVAAQTGTGSTFAMQTSPTLTTPNIGVATGTTYLTAGSSSNSMVRPVVGSARLLGEISGTGTALGADDGFMRLSAGGGSDPSVKSFIDLAGYSVVSDVAQTITLGTSGVERMRIAAAGGVQLSGGTSLTLTAGAVGMSKITASASAPGASGAKLELVCGTNAGTAKLVISAGTSATTVTVIDNIGGGVTGC